AQRILRCVPDLPAPAPDPDPDADPSPCPSDPLAPLLAATRSSPSTLLSVLDPERGEAGQRAPHPALAEGLGVGAAGDRARRVGWRTSDALEAWADAQEQEQGQEQ
ncbi:hypothetical protein JCM21900_003886, partial [Sporobolomyces salmonicolor]